MTKEEKSEYMREIGRKGGRNSFGKNPERARLAGKVGGRKSRRGKAKQFSDENGQ